MFDYISSLSYLKNEKDSIPFHYKQLARNVSFHDNINKCQQQLNSLLIHCSSFLKVYKHLIIAKADSRKHCVSKVVEHVKIASFRALGVPVDIGCKRELQT